MVIFHHGGTYLLKGDEDIESLEYANPTTIGLVGHTNHFQLKVEGDTLIQIGIGNPWREVWKRVGTEIRPNFKLTGWSGVVGAWTLVGEPGAFKFIADSSWCDTTVDSKTKVVTFHHGGTCTLEEKRYVENVEYANPGTMSIIGYSFKFDVSVEGDTLRVVGIENPWNQTWKRAN